MISSYSSTTASASSASVDKTPLLSAVARIFCSYSFKLESAVDQFSLTKLFYTMALLIDEKPLNEAATLFMLALLLEPTNNFVIELARKSC